VRRVEAPACDVLPVLRALLAAALAARGPWRP
jgi:hypothetical protein